MYDVNLLCECMRLNRMSLFNPQHVNRLRHYIIATLNLFLFTEHRRELPEVRDHGDDRKMLVGGEGIPGRNNTRALIEFTGFQLLNDIHELFMLDCPLQTLLYLGSMVDQCDGHSSTLHATPQNHPPHAAPPRNEPKRLTQLHGV